MIRNPPTKANYGALYVYLFKLEIWIKKNNS